MRLSTISLFGFPRINSLDDLAFHTKLSKSLLNKFARITDAFYVQFYIPKKSGGKRQITCPSKKIKAVQAWILKNILIKVELHPSATAFRKNNSILSNVNPHTHNRYFLCYDIKDFFGSIKIDTVFHIFQALGYNENISFMLARICTYRGSLPQGGVTSPTLSNIACKNLDERLSRYAGVHDLVYTRYADDMTFSAKSPAQLQRCRLTIERIIESEGFNINEQKRRVIGKRQKPSITGLIISDQKIARIDREQKRKVRAGIHRLLTVDLNEDERTILQNWVLGWVNYIKGIDPESYSQLKQFYKSKMSIEKQIAVTNEDLWGFYR